MGTSVQKPSRKNTVGKVAKEDSVARFVVRGLSTDRELIRSLAKHLADAGPDSDRVRSIVNSSLSDDPNEIGGIYKWLRESPLVGADLDLRRPRKTTRKADL